MQRALESLKNSGFLRRISAAWTIDAPSAIRTEAAWLNQQHVRQLRTAVAAVLSVMCGALLATLMSIVSTAATWGYDMAPQAPAMTLSAVLAITAGAAIFANAINHAPRHIALGIIATLFAIALAALPFDITSLQPTDISAGPGSLWFAVVRVAGLPVLALTVALIALQSSFPADPSSDKPARILLLMTLGGVAAWIIYPLVIDPVVALEIQSRHWTLLFVATGMSVVAVLAKASTNHTFAMQSSEGATTSFAALYPSSESIRTAGHAGVLAAVLAALITEVAEHIAPTAMATNTLLGLAIAAMALARHIRRTPPWLWTAIAILALAAITSADHPTTRIVLATVACVLIATRYSHALIRNEPTIGKPATWHLAALSAGACLGTVSGGLVSSLVAPTVSPLSVTLIAALAAAPGFVEDKLGTREARRLLAVTLLALAVALTASALSEPSNVGIRVALILLILIPTVTTLNITAFWPERRAVYLLAALAAIAVLPSPWRTLEVSRSPWSGLRVDTRTDSGARRLIAGNIVLASSQGPSVTSTRQAAAIASLTRGISAIRAVRQKEHVDLPLDGPAPARATPLLIGMIANGAGALSCLAEPGDAVRLFAADPATTRLTTDRRWFDDLPRCTPQARLILGTPRATLAREPDEVFDLLIIDASATLGPPFPLLTSTALRSTIGKLAPNGVLALHLAREQLDLTPWVSEIIAAMPTIAAAAVPGNVVFLSRNAAALEDIAAWPDAEGIPRRMTARGNERHIPLLSLWSRRNDAAD